MDGPCNGISSIFKVYIAINGNNSTIRINILESQFRPAPAAVGKSKFNFSEPLAWKLDLEALEGQLPKYL